ncbi:5699_t:CDS:2 [Diversispora eburnea]|uniref:5699_t:CDS:1 n=1 Tax=Diversispora eburnea TaxID=1213867 RepID=A0A9N8YHS6_9GLOM|nr:5699_t:CDS:2 [Diversispora eburnea]
MERADVINKDPAMKRQEKIARYKREKETKAKLEKLQQLLSSIENDNDKEDIDRNCVLTCIDLFIQKSIEQLSSINQEMDLLNNMRKSEDHIKQSGVNEKEIVPSTNTLKDGNGPLLSSEGRPLRPFIITSKREEIRQQVFRPGWRLPTMTIDEYLQQEKERGNIISGGGQMPEKKEINDNDEEAIDAETYRLRELDEFKDVNPRGWENEGYQPIYTSNTSPIEIEDDEDIENDNVSVALLSKPEIPKDKYKFVYLIFFVQGLAQLLGWNVFITASVFFKSRFRGSSYEDSFENYFSFIFMSSNLIFLIHALYTQKSANLSHRITFSLLVSMITFLLVAISTKYENFFTPSGYFYFITLMVFVSGIVSAYMQNGTFGIVSRFPPTHVQAVMSGQGAATSISQIFISLASADDLAHGAFIYFISAFIVIILAFILHFGLIRLPLYLHYIPIEKTIVENPPNLTNLNNRLILDTFAKIRIMAFAVAFVFVVTLGIFPSITALIKSVTDDENKNKFQMDYLFIPLHFLIYNLGDWFGRSLPTFESYVITDPKKLASMSISRIIFIPLFLLCNVDVGVTGKRILPLLINNDLLYLFILSLFATSNGYLTSLLMMAAPQLENVEKDLAGTIMTFFLVFGLSIGSIISFPLRYLSCGGECV